MPRSIRLLVTIAVGLVAILGGLTLLVRLLEPRLAFFPAAGETTTPAESGIPYEQVTIGTRDGERLRGWWLARDSARARIVYFHGNGGNLSVWAPILVGVARRGSPLIAFDYRGYGLSSGRASERGLYRDVEAIVEWVSREGPADVPVIYWGRSLGVSMAAHAAMTRPPDGLILESGFPDARRLMRDSPLLAALSLLSTYRFDAVERLQRIGKPVAILVMHGDADRIVPIRHGRALYDAIDGPKRFVTIRGGDHNDPAPSDPAAYWEAVGGFVRSIESGARGENVWH